MKKYVMTNHGIERIVEREEVKPKMADNYASRAWRKGKVPEDYSNNTVKRKLMSIKNRHDSSTVVRIFANGCYIFSKDGVLITEYPLEEFMRVYNKPAKKYRFDDWDTYDIPA